MQATVAQPVRIEGVGLHTGRRTRVEIGPADSGHGIRFVRSDRAGDEAEIPARHQCVGCTAYRTELVNAHGVRLATVEHLLAALAVLGIDNARVRVEGPEMPILDGSALPFAEAILDAGIVVTGGQRRAIRILRRVQVKVGAASMVLLPAPEFRLTCSIEFASPAIGRQEFEVDGIGPGAVRSILPARTFAELESIESLRAAGLARGGSFDNAVVVSGNKVLNESGLRFTDEFVRHKSLDVIGDLYLAGAPIVAHCIAERPGHEVTRRLLSAVFSTPGAWAWADAEAYARPVGNRFAGDREIRPELA